MQAGDIFNSWTLLSQVEAKNRRERWLCRCVCGFEKPVDAYNLLSGRSRSCRKCACIKVGAIHRTHGQTKGKVYRAWQAMKNVCYNPNAQAYPYIGRLRIRVCDVWITDFEQFAVDMGDPPSPLHTLDRLDWSADYRLGNVVWCVPYEKALRQRAWRKHCPRVAKSSPSFSLGPDVG